MVYEKVIITIVENEDEIVTLNAIAPLFDD